MSHLQYEDRSTCEGIGEGEKGMWLRLGQSVALIDTSHTHLKYQTVLFSGNGWGGSGVIGEHSPTTFQGQMDRSCPLSFSR